MKMFLEDAEVGSGSSDTIMAGIVRHVFDKMAFEAAENPL